MISRITFTNAGFKLSLDIKNANLQKPVIDDRRCAKPKSTWQCPPFNDHRSQLIGSSLFCYNSPAAAAREVFKPSPDSASLVVSSQKKIFSFGLGVLLGGRHKWGCFGFLWSTLTGPGRPSNGPTFCPKYFYETRLSHESLEP